MGSLSSELGPHIARLVDEPRIYADANIPRGVVTFMRTTLGWDVLFVLEHDELRRASDLHHYRLARQLGRTLVTLDRDYIDWLRRLLKQVDEQVFRAAETSVPLEGRKITWQIDTTA
jgi:predicted nuclease of predicted toxin-antitoxin system